MKTMKMLANVWLAGEVMANLDLYLLALKYLVVLAAVALIVAFILSKTVLKR